MVDYLPKRLQLAWRAKLQQAYRRPTYETAHAELHRLHGELRRLRGYRALPQLRVALKQGIKKGNDALVA